MSIISFRCHTTIHLAPLVNQETIHQDMDRGTAAYVKDQSGNP